jgi:hypothetical protein
MGTIRFAEGWNSSDNNVNIYRATATRPASSASQREIYVMLHKMPTARLWCHPSERGSAETFVSCVTAAESPLCVDKGIHPDKYHSTFGYHMSVAVDWGPNVGLKCHLYGQVMQSGAWEIELITLFDPKLYYKSKDIMLLQQGVAPPQPIVVVSSGVPPAQFGSIAYFDQMRYF